MTMFGSKEKHQTMCEYSSVAMEETGSAFQYHSTFEFGDPNTNSVAYQKKYSSAFTYSRPVTGIRRGYDGEAVTTPESTTRTEDDSPPKTWLTKYRAESTVDSWTYAIVSSVVLLFSWCVLLLTFPATLWYYLKVLSQHERLLVFRLGRLQPLKGPGSVITLPFVDNWQRIDTRVRAFSIPPQQFITADNGVVELGADVQLQVVDLVRSAMHIRDLDHATRTLGQTILVNSLCKKTCSQLEKEKSYISIELRENFNQTTMDWGVEIIRVEMSHIKVLKPPNESSAVGPVLSALRGMFTPSTSSASPGSSSSDDSLLASPPFGIYEQLQQNLHDLTSSSSLGGIEFLLRLEIVGSQPAIFGLEVKAGSGRVLRENEITRIPDAALSMSEDDLHAIFNHTVTPLQAYIGGKLQVQGDVQLLMRLEGLLKSSKEHHSRRRAIMTV